MTGQVGQMADGLAEHGVADGFGADIEPGEDFTDFHAFFTGGIELIEQDEFFFGHG